MDCSAFEFMDLGGSTQAWDSTQDMTCLSGLIAGYVDSVDGAGISHFR